MSFYRFQSVLPVDYRWVMFLWSCQETPLQWFQWSALCWYWNLHQRPFHWWDCWGYRFRSVQTTGGHVPVKLSRNPPSVVQWSALCWYWNLHQRPFHWWDCWGYRFRSVQTTGGCCSCEETPSVVASDHPFLILEPPPEASPLVGLLGYRFQSCSCEAVKEPPFSGYQWSALFWYWNLHQRPFHWCDCWGYRFQSCSDHRCGCSEGSPTRSRGDHWDPYLPCAEFWTGTGPVQATGRVTSQPVMRDTGTSSVQTAGCGHRNPARATG